MNPLETTEVERLIQAGESLTSEFKSERGEALSDREIYETVVCLANGRGGVLLIGVEDDRTVTARGRGTVQAPIRNSYRRRSSITRRRRLIPACQSISLPASPL